MLHHCTTPTSTLHYHLSPSSPTTTAIINHHHHHFHPTLQPPSSLTAITITTHHNNHHSLPRPLLSHTNPTNNNTTYIHPLHYDQDPKQLQQTSHITTTTLKSKLVSVDRFPGEFSRARGPFEDQVYSFCNFKFLCNLIYPET